MPKTWEAYKKKPNAHEPHPYSWSFWCLGGRGGGANFEGATCMGRMTKDTTTFPWWWLGIETSLSKLQRMVAEIVGWWWYFGGTGSIEREGARNQFERGEVYFLFFYSRPWAIHFGKLRVEGFLWSKKNKEGGELNLKGRRLGL